MSDEEYSPVMWTVLEKSATKELSQTLLDNRQLSGLQ